MFLNQVFFLFNITLQNTEIQLNWTELEWIWIGMELNWIGGCMLIMLQADSSVKDPGWDGQAFHPDQHSYLQQGRRLQEQIKQYWFGNW